MFVNRYFNFSYDFFPKFKLREKYLKDFNVYATHVYWITVAQEDSEEENDEEEENYGDTYGASDNSANESQESDK